MGCGEGRTATDVGLILEVTCIVAVLREGTTRAEPGAKNYECHEAETPMNDSFNFSGTDAAGRTAAQFVCVCVKKGMKHEGRDCGRSTRRRLTKKELLVWEKVICHAAPCR